jgi:hypothetical protein
MSSSQRSAALMVGAAVVAIKTMLRVRVHMDFHLLVIIELLGDALHGAERM